MKSQGILNKKLKISKFYLIFIFYLFLLKNINLINDSPMRC